MGAWDLGPFENDSALDFVDEFLDVESPARSIRSALSALKNEGYHDNDVVTQAWAACELVAIAVSGGDGYDPDEASYEAAARLRPNKKLINECLQALPHLLDDNSELSGLIDEEQRGAVEESIGRTRERLEHGLTLDKFTRLKVPKVKALHVYAIPAANKWMLALSDYTTMTILDITLEEKPADIEAASTADAGVLFRCRYIGVIDELEALGRHRPSGTLADPAEFITILRHGCLSVSSTGDFENNYWLTRGSENAQLNYAEAKNYPYCAELYPESLFETLTDYVETGAVRLPPLPTPLELRDEFIDGCREEWAPYLEGDKGGPFSFPRVYAYDVGPYLAYWVRYHLQTDWNNAGMCLPDDLNKYFLAGLVAACVGVYSEADVPEGLRPVLTPLRKVVNRRDVGASAHTLSCLLNEASIIPHVLQDDPDRRADFLAQASKIRDGLEAALNR